MLDFTPVRDKVISFAELTKNLTYKDLYALTNEMVDTMLDIIQDATDADVTFVPFDPEAKDTFAAPDSGEENLSWTLGHVIVHTTASSEESAALAVTLARGILTEGRSRSEVPWRTVHTVAQLRERLEESRRMRLAFLDAWPGQPNLEIATTSPRFGTINAITRFVFGLSHDDAHLNQLREIMRQARAARSAV